MKRSSLFALALLLVFLISACNFQVMKVVQSTLVTKYLAVIVLGSNEFKNASERCFDLMSMWTLNGTRCYDIMYLSSDLSITPRANLTANAANFRWVLTNWLSSSSTPDTEVWIWIFSHGVGLHHHSPLSVFDDEWWSVDPVLFGGRVETSSDEGSEINEALIGGSDRWVGVDEGINLSPASGKETVWDDDLRDWLVGMSYRKMTIFISTCRSSGASENETGSCYGGGLIDDLSAPRRTIIAPTNETYSAWYNETTGIGWFEEAFMNALDYYNPAHLEARNLIDYDYVTSVLEAYVYACDHDMARKAVRNPSGNEDQDPWRDMCPNWKQIDERPWFDDGGNFLPTFKNCSDVGEDYSETVHGYYGFDSGDGQLARYTWLMPGIYSGCPEDVNDDRKVDARDVTMATSTYGSRFPSKWSSSASLADINSDNKVDAKDVARIAAKFGWHAP